MLALLEPVWRPVLPFTAGQLSSFRNDGVAGPTTALLDAPLQRLPHRLMDLETMLSSSSAEFASNV